MQPKDMTVVPPVPAAERFTIGLALSRSGRIWLQNLPLFLGVALLAQVPEFVLSYLSIGNSPWGPLGQRAAVIPTSLLGYVVTENVEDPRIRSTALTAGHRGELFGLQAVIYLGLMVVVVLVGLALPEKESPLGNAITPFPSAVFISFRSVVEGVTYFLLRSEKEGVDVAQLTAVFE
jgi:hypothetical protein